MALIDNKLLQKAFEQRFVGGAGNLLYEGFPRAEFPLSSGLPPQTFQDKFRILPHPLEQRWHNHASVA